MSTKKKQNKTDHTVVIDMEMCRIYKKVYAKSKGGKISVKREIIQIGAVLLDEQGNIQDRFKRNLHPKYGKLERHVKEITGITKEDLVDAPSFAEVLEEFLEWIPGGKLQIVSWGSEDKNQLKKECMLKNIKIEGKLMSLFSRWIDLQSEYISKISLCNQVSLGDALRISGLEPEGEFHDALDDALNTAMLFQKILRKQELVEDAQFYNEKKQKEEEQRRMREEKEAKARKEQEEENLPEMDYDSAEENLIVFYGNDSSPLPQELFVLWEKVMSHGYKTYPCACCLNQSYYEIEEYDKELNIYTSCDDCYWDMTEQTYYPSNTTVGISLYHDRNLDRKMFAIVMTTGGEGIGERLYGRNTLVVEAEQWLEDEYKHWTRVRRKNSDKYNQMYVPSADLQQKEHIRFLNNLACETCLYDDQCDRLNCIYSA